VKATPTSEMAAAHELSVGIDLGTTFSILAYLDEGGRPRVIPSLEGGAATPSIVYFDSSGVAVGKGASKLARHDATGLAQFAKRDMGKAKYRFPIRGQDLPPEVIQALVLRKLKEDASITLGEFRKVVITVPAYFNEPRRKATMDAGRLAGLEVVDIINEPTAAAIAYGVQQGFLNDRGESQRAEKILVYDLGGGTFDVTLMEIDGRSYRALATDGDVYLGGIDWDQRIADHLAEKFQAAHGVDLRGDPVTRQMLLEEAEDAKRALSVRNKTVVHLAFDGRRAEIPLAVEQLEEMTGDLCDRTVFTVRSVLRDANLRWSDLTRILLVGGSSRMPIVQKALQRETSTPLDRSMLSEEPVAMGAAIYAGLLQTEKTSSRPDISVQGICSHPLGVLGIEPESGLPRRKVLIPRNAPLPAQGTGVFRTQKDRQERVYVRVVEGGDDAGKNATPVGVCVVSDLPGNLPAGTQVVVRFTYGTNGRLQVKAALAGKTSDVTLVLERPAGLSAAALEEWENWIRDGAVLTPIEPPQKQPEPTAEAEAEPEKPAAEPAADQAIDWSFLGASTEQKPTSTRPAESPQKASKSPPPKPKGKTGPAKPPAPPARDKDDDSGLSDFFRSLG
jgi:molecular chaperone DnaK